MKIEETEMRRIREVKRLGEIAEIVMGQSPSGEACNSRGQGLPLLNGPTEFGYHHPVPVQFTIDPRKQAKPWDILFCVRGSTTGRMNWADCEYAIGRGIAAIRHKSGRDYQHFLRGLIDFKLPELLAQATGSTFPNISYGQLVELRCDLPNKEEQRAIAHILGTLDDKIELNRRMNETLEAIAQTIFKSWFVDFDPVRAKAESYGPGLPEPITDFFPNYFVDSELGEIPGGWKVLRMGDVVTTILGGTPSRAEPSYWGGDIPWINSGKANEFRVIEPSEFITKSGLDNSATKLLPARTTVIAITGATLGQVSLTEIETCANQSIVGVLGNTVLPNEFLYFWIKNRIGDLLAWQTGGAQQHINKDNVNDLRILVPNGPIMQIFITQVRSFFDWIKECCFESLTLAAIRDALLPKLLSGELRTGAGEIRTAQRA